MAKGYRPVDRDQEFLLPPNMIDWLDADHLVWFVIDTVAALDTSVLHERAALRRDGQPVRSTAGRAGYDPDMLLTLLIYGYACGERSSRRLERLCATDVAFRLICAGDVPDHTVIARFRQIHEPVFAELFTQVLRLCRVVGLVALGTIAIDGTKIAANAAKDANHDEGWLRAQAAHPGAAGGERVVVEQILTEAGALDAAEDTLFDTARGDELPAELTDRTRRRERLTRALDRIAEQEAAEQHAREAVVAEQVTRARARLTAAEQALDQTRARQQGKIDDWERVWEKAIATRGPLPKGRGPAGVDDAIAVRRAVAAVQRARANLAAQGQRGSRRPTGGGGGGGGGGEKKHPPRANLTDPDSRLMPTRNGWIQGYNFQFAVSADQMILVLDVTDQTNDVTSCRPMMAAAATVAAELDDLSPTPPPVEPDDWVAPVFLFDAGYASDDNLTAAGPNRLIALGKSHSITAAAHDNPASGPPPPHLSARDAMDHRLRTPEGAALYRRRGATVEPAIGNFKKILAGLSRRGRQAALSEGHFAATVFNLLKIYRAAHT